MQQLKIWILLDGISALFCSASVGYQLCLDYIHVLPLEVETLSKFMKQYVVTTNLW